MLSRPENKKGYVTRLLQGTETLFPQHASLESSLLGTRCGYIQPCPARAGTQTLMVLSPSVPAHPPHPTFPVRSQDLAQNSEKFSDSGSQQQLTLVIS